MEREVYHFVARPVDVAHQHPYLVFDCQDRLHMPLTAFGKEAVTQQSTGTARTYLYALLPFFTFLDTDIWQQRAGKQWDGPAEDVRQSVQEYLVQHLQCKVREHRLGFQLVSLTQGTRSTIRVFLSGLKLFYRIMKQQGRYTYANPLVDPTSTFYALLDEVAEKGDDPPRMPQCSGVEFPRRKQRLSDSYFKLEDEIWIPQIVDDPTLPGRILAGGRKVGWRLREECLTRLLFESGCRISEAVGLTLGDWLARGLLQEANAFSKGSHGVRVKFLRFSSDTAKLLRRYFDEERVLHDPNRQSLTQYLQLIKQDKVNADMIPLFLSTRGTPLSAKTFRENFWNAACQAAQIEVDIHQCRHWYITQAVRQIHETAQAEGEVKRRLRELIEYIKWKQGWQTMEAYQHYFDASRHAEIQDALHRKMAQEVRRELDERCQPTGRKRKQLHPSPSWSVSSAQLIPDDPDFAFLRSLGGVHHAS